MQIKNRVFINNFSTITSAGQNADELFDNILNKKTGIKAQNSFIKDKIVAIGLFDNDKNFQTLLVESCEKVLKESNLEDFSNTLLVIGSSVGGMYLTEKSYFQDKSFKNINFNQNSIYNIAYILKNNFKFYDDISFSTACTSSANAISYAYEALQKGIYKNALIVGADAITKITVGGFSSLELISQKQCTPFDKNRDGMNVAEGIGVLLLQNQKSKNSVEVVGVGYSSDAHHMTQPHPKGEGILKAMNLALNDANISANQIDYINAHGTATMANDNAEALALKKIFQNNTYISSTKSITGHTLGASSAIEAIVSAMAILKQIIPPNTNLSNPEIEGLKYSYEAKKEKINFVMSNSFAFGGNNVSLIFGAVN